VSAITTMGVLVLPEGCMSFLSNTVADL